MCWLQLYRRDGLEQTDSDFIESAELSQRYLSDTCVMPRSGIGVVHNQTIVESVSIPGGFVKQVGKKHG